jgi:hypothetical protein
MPPAPPLADDPAPSPVFVDDSGRRHRAVRVLGWFVGAVMVGYLGLLGVSLVGSPGLVPLSLPSLGRVLPGPAAPLIAGPAHSPASTGELIAPPAGRVPTPRTPAAATRPRTTARPAPTGTPRPTPTPTASVAPTQAAQPTPKARTHATHSPSAHPNPHSTGRSASLASPSPTGTAT